MKSTAGIWSLVSAVRNRSRPSAYIQPTRRHVGADEDAVLGVAELEKRVGPLLLLLLAVQVQHGAVDVVEQLRVVLDRVAAGEEDDDLLLLLLHPRQEGEEEDEALVGVAEHVALFQTLDGAVLLLLVDVDVERARPQRDAGEVLCTQGKGGVSAGGGGGGGGEAWATYRLWSSASPRRAWFGGRRWLAP